MTKKPHYTDPLKAAWMVREFGVKLGIKHNGKLVWDWIDVLNTPHPATTPEDILEDYPHELQDKYYIHPDSLDIFEPRVDDLVLLGEDDAYFVTSSNEWWDANKDKDCLRYSFVTEKEAAIYIDEGDMNIIQRQGKAFFQPESDE